MCAYLLDTSVLSALLDSDHPKHDEALAAMGKMAPNSMKYVSAISLAELRFGVRWPELKSGSHAPRLRGVLTDAGKYAVLDVTKQTAEAYGELKARMAVKYLRNTPPPRWIEDWEDGSTGKKLQIDENDLWQCAQAKERGLVFVTADKGIRRIAAADPALSIRVV